MPPTRSTLPFVLLALASATLPARATAQAVAPARRPLTLDEAVQLAQRNAPAVIQARGQLRTSNAVRRSAFAAFIPNLSVNANTTQQSPASALRTSPSGEIIGGGRWAQSQGFNANLELFSGLRRFYDIRSSRAQIDAAESGEIAQRAQVALEVKQQYYASLAALENEAAAEVQLAEAEQQMRAAGARVQARTATASDSLRARIQVGNAQLALLQARTDRESADAALARVVGTLEPVSAFIGDSARVVPGELALDSATLASLVEDGPAVLEARANLAAARASSRTARSPYLPTITMSYGRNINQSSESFAVFSDDPRYSGSFRFSVNYPIWNQYAREETVVRADVAETNAEAALRDARLAARQNVVQFTGALRTARQRARIQGDAVLAAQEDLRIQRQRYELGASTLLDVLTSQTQLTQARVALIQARLDARLAQAQLEALAGRELPTTP